MYFADLPADKESLHKMGWDELHVELHIIAAMWKRVVWIKMIEAVASLRHWKSLYWTNLKKSENSETQLEQIFYIRYRSLLTSFCEKKRKERILSPESKP